MIITKTSFEKIYKDEQDVKAKERILLVLNVIYQGMIAARAARNLHRSSRAWAWEWLKRYGEEGIDGLKDRTKSGRPTDMPEEIVFIK